jgi:type IV secretory pathway component VirB8
VNEISKLNPWTAKPLTDAAKNAKFRAVMDLSAERVILGRSAIIAGWTIGGVGVACLAASVAGWVALMPLKTTVVKFFLVDKSTGIIGAPVGIEDAPKLFGAAVEQQYLHSYIEAREAWVPEMDEYNDHLTKLMSTPAEQARYADSRNAPTGPVRALGKDGHVSLQNFRFHPLAIGKDGETRRYLVQFDRTVWHGENKDPTQPWSATVDFQWHPGLSMLPADRTDNPGGFQVLSYSASSDTPDKTRE